jgi:hypothetical protein
LPPLAGLKWAALGALPLLAFRLSFGAWLNGGMARVEAHVAGFHLAQGALLGLACAVAAGPDAWRRGAGLGRIFGWVLTGCVGGALGEVADFSFNFHGWMGAACLWLWDAAHLADDPALVYQTLQVLRLGGPVLALGLLFWAEEGDALRRFGALVLAVGALMLRSRVRGFLLVWSVLPSLKGLGELALYAASAILVAWAFGAKSLTSKSDLP